MGLRHPLRSLPPASPAPVWGSLVVMGAGFGGVLLGWSIVAGTDRASRQVAPAVGLGLGGLALVALGTGLLVLAVGHRDDVLLARLRRSGTGTVVASDRTLADRLVDVALWVVVAAGVLGMAVGAHGAAREDDLQYARPYLVSGGLGGLSLVVAALGVLVVRARRRAALRDLATEGGP